MAENSNIEWTNHTFNPWIGCTKVSPACDHCYAEQVAKRMQVSWGSGELRKRTSAANWKEPRKWDRKAAREGVRYRVFCASLADVFDNEVPTDWREDLWQLIRETPNLDWLLLTKRVGNIWNMLPEDWGNGWSNVWLGITVVTQAEADRDVSKLLKVPAALRFISAEPLLGPINLTRLARETENWTFFDDALTGFRAHQCGGSSGNNKIDWVIAGGESGPDARPMHPDWVRSLRDQCVGAGVPFFFKQWGEWAPNCDHGKPLSKPACTTIGRPAPGKKGVMFRCGKKNAGRTLDGETWDQVPEQPQ